MISHNMEDVRAVADRIVVLRLGRNNGVFTRPTSNEELIGGDHRRHRQRRLAAPSAPGGQPRRPPRNR